MGREKSDLGIGRSLVEALGAAAELAALQRLYETAEPVDLGLRLTEFGIVFGHKRADHRVQRVDVFGQRGPSA